MAWVKKIPYAPIYFQYEVDKKIIIKKQITNDGNEWSVYMPENKDNYIQIEIYPNKMMEDFLRIGLVNADDKKSIFVFCSSYIERLQGLKGYFGTKHNNNIFFQFQQTEDPNNPASFTDAMAEMLATFIKLKMGDANKLHDADHVMNMQTIYICCDDSQNRSAAIAAAIYRCLSINIEREWLWNTPHLEPNILVYQKTCKALGIDISADEVRELKRINGEAFRSAIEHGTNITRNLYRYGLNSKVSIEKRVEYFDLLNHLDSSYADNLL